MPTGNPEGIDLQTRNTSGDVDDEPPYISRCLWYLDEAGQRSELGDHELTSRPEPLVILGEPGMGKSWLLRNIAASAGLAKLEARQLIRHPKPEMLIGNAQLVVIDALDEVATKAEGDAIDQILSKLALANHPKFILSCRVADWQAATSVAGISDDYGVRPLQLHLVPFDRAQQRAALAVRVGDERAEQMLEHFDNFGLDFLGNPQTLNLIAQLPADRPLPATRRDLLEQAVLRLRKEHSDRKAAGELAEEQALDAAGAAFAGILISGNSAIVRRASANLDDGEIALADIEAFGGGHVGRVIGTRLFSGANERFTYCHRRIAEYLGARWLIRQANNRTKRKRLLHLFHAQGLVPASLRGLHAWLALDEDLAPAVIAADPMGVIEYGDTDTMSAAHAKLLLHELARLAETNPQFRRWGKTPATALMSDAVAPLAWVTLKDQQAPFALRQLIIHQLEDEALASRYGGELLAMLRDPREVFSLRASAGDALGILPRNDWPELVEDLRRMGDWDSRRLAYELLEDRGLAPFSDNLIVDVVLAYAGLTFVTVDRQTSDRMAARFWRFPHLVPDERLEGLLDLFVEYFEALTCANDGERHLDLIDLIYALILRCLHAGEVEPGRLLGWVALFAKRPGYPTNRKQIPEWISANPQVRRQIQRYALLEQTGGNLKERHWHLAQSGLGAIPDEADIVALLEILDPHDRTDMRWRELVQLVSHSGPDGQAIRDTARPFVAHNPQLQAWLERLGAPRQSRRERKLASQQRRRRAKKTMRFEEFRRDYRARRDDMDNGTYGAVVQPAEAYLKKYIDVGQKLPAHERVADWIGPDLAKLAHRGFEAFLVRKPPRPDARRIAISLGHDQCWNAGSIIVAALAERYRTRIDPFGDLPGERILAGLFELWRSRIDDHAGLGDLLPSLEAETKRRNLWECAHRLYITAQLKFGRRPNIDRLHELMGTPEDLEMASALASEWLTRFPDVPAEAEAKMIMRLLQSDRRHELKVIGDERRKLALDDERRRNWDVVQIMVDFDAAAARLTSGVEADLIWSLSHLAASREEDRPTVPLLGAQQMEWVISTFRILWPDMPGPLGVREGRQNPCDATDFINGRISALARDTSDDARAALETLRYAPTDGYTPHLKVVLAEQAQRHVDANYQPPSLSQVKAILTADMPVSSADLQATMLDALTDVQGRLKGDDVDWYRSFFRENGRHKDEEPCRDEIIKMLRVVDGRFQYTPEAHVADEKRVDIVVGAGNKRIVPIEVKGAWHRDLWTAADRQLDHRYVNDWRAECGIYLVLWFDDRSHRTAQPDGSKCPVTPETLRQALTAGSAAVRSGRVEVVVLDLTRPTAVA